MKRKKSADKPTVPADPAKQEAMIDERVLAVAEACAKHDGRVVLFGVHMKGAVVQATDGKILLQARLEKPGAYEPADMPDVIVPTRRLVAGAKVTATPVPTGQSVEMEEPDGTRTTFFAYSGKFPETKEVIPKSDPSAMRFSLAPRLLMRLCKAALRAGADAMTIESPPKPTNAVRVTFHDSCSRQSKVPLLTGIIMPMKTDNWGRDD